MPAYVSASERRLAQALRASRGLLLRLLRMTRTTPSSTFVRLRSELARASRPAAGLKSAAHSCAGAFSFARRRGVVAALFACVTLDAHAASPPHRIVSLNPCLDAILLDVADPSQIAALSRYSIYLASPGWPPAPGASATSPPRGKRSRRCDLTWCWSAAWARASWTWCCRGCTSPRPASPFPTRSPRARPRCAGWRRSQVIRNAARYWWRGSKRRFEPRLPRLASRG